MNENPLALLPELFLAGSAVVGLLAGSWLPRSRQWPVPLLAAAACVAGIVAAAAAAPGRPTVAFGTSFAIDTLTSSVRIVVLAATLLVLCISLRPFAADPRETELYVLLQLAALGTIVLAGANDLLLLFAGYLLASVPLYALAGFRKDDVGAEAALKYYLMGALLGVLMLTGVTVLDGALRSTAYGRIAAAAASAPQGAVAVGLVALLAGLLFKMGGVPAHFWVPDVADGAPTAVAAFVTTIPKLGGLAAEYRLLDIALQDATLDWRLLVAILAAASMTLGNLAALFQTRVKRLLGYSTVSQVGYMLMAVVVAGRSDLAQKSLLFYLAAYAVTNLGAFAVVAALPHAATLDDYRGLARRRPALAAVLVVCLLGLVGTPPTAVFVGKLEVFTATVDGSYAWLAAVAVVNTVASLFYYLRWLVPAVLLDSTGDGVSAPVERVPAVGAYAAGAGALLLGPLAGLVLPLLDGALLR